MPAPRADPSAKLSRGQFFGIWLVGGVLLSAGLAAIYTVGQWLGVPGNNWIDGLVQGFIAPPVVLGTLAVRQRWIRRRQADK
jgi:hypothetical protein